MNPGTAGLILARRGCLPSESLGSPWLKVSGTSRLLQLDRSSCVTAFPQFGVWDCWKFVNGEVSGEPLYRSGTL